MSYYLYYLISAVLSIGVLLGISMMSRVKTARLGNALSALCMLLAILVVFIHYGIVSNLVVWLGLAVGAVVGICLPLLL